MTGPCRSYVAWVNEETKNWATWEPGDRVDLGEIGYFDRSLQFTHEDYARDLLSITPRVHQLQEIGSRLHYSSRYFSITAEAGVESDLAGGSVTFTLKKGEGHILHLAGGVCEGVRNEREILKAAKEAVVSGDWGLRWVLVCERTRTSGGFAVVCREKGASVTLRAGAKLPDDVTRSTLAEAGLRVVRTEGRVNSYEFGADNTPIFNRTWKIQSRLVDQLYGAEAEWVDSNRLFYRPNISRIRQDELDGMKVRDIFETGFSVSSLS